MTTSASRAIIDLSAYASNLRTVRQMLPPDCSITAVVKANAYGHGMTSMAERAVQEGVQMLGVSTVEEGVQLRDAGFKCPILVLMQPAIEAMPAAVENNLRLMVSDTAAAERLGELARKNNKVVPIHCKVDCGMGRQGFNLQKAEANILYLTRISNIDIEGIATHFPVADLQEDSFTANQIKMFRSLLRQLEKVGVPYEMAHAANSAAILNYPASTFNMVRPGLLTFGVWPTANSVPSLDIKPVLRWETRITLIKEVAPGDSIGYGRTFTTENRMRLAILPVGYADGFKHSLSNNADVLIKGRRCRVRGSVSMDQMCADITGMPDVEVDDVATLIGSDGQHKITVEELAHKAQTIPYDILTGIGQRVRREYK